jgi:hypothetical protein
VWGWVGEAFVGVVPGEARGTHDGGSGHLREVGAARVPGGGFISMG